MKISLRNKMFMKVILLTFFCSIFLPAKHGFGREMEPDTYNRNPGYHYQDQDREEYHHDDYYDDSGKDGYRSDRNYRERDQNEYRKRNRATDDYRRHRRDQNSAENGKREMARFAEEVFRRTNAERERHGLPPLRSVMVLSVIADKRAIEITRHFSHSRPDGRSWETILREHDVKWTACGENIAKGQRTPAEVVSGWMNSPGHRKNILSPKYTHLGIGIRRDPSGSLCWTQNFINPVKR